MPRGVKRIPPTMKTMADFEAKDTLDTLYDFGLTVDEGLAAGLIGKVDDTPELRTQEEESKRYTSIYDSDPLFGIDGDEDRD